MFITTSKSTSNFMTSSSTKSRVIFFSFYMNFFININNITRHKKGEKFINKNYLIPSSNSFITLINSILLEHWKNEEIEILSFNEIVKACP